MVSGASRHGTGVGGAAVGVGLHFWEGDGVRRLAFPLGLLLFVVPIPPAVLNPVVLELQFLPDQKIILKGLFLLICTLKVNMLKN